MNQKATLVFLAISALLTGMAVWGSFQLDGPVRRAVVASQGKSWKKSPAYRFHSRVRVWGDWPPLMAAAAVGLGLARWKRNRKWMRILVAAMLASTLAGIVANSLRLTTGRTRPRESPKIEQGFYGLRHNGEWLVGNPAYNSFPSGHTATAFGFAAAIAISSPAWGGLALAAAALVAWSSIAMGAHHPSDVFVSFLLAWVVAWVVTRAILRWGNLDHDKADNHG